MKKISSDYIFLGISLLILVFGLVMLTSASMPVGHNEFGDRYFFIKNQLLFGVLPGLVALIFFVNFNYKYLKKLAWVIYGISLTLLILVLIPGIGSTLNTTSQSWLVLGGITVQPSELAKLGLIIFLGYYLSELGEEITSLSQGFLPALSFGIIPIILISLQPDLGTSSILFGILFGMLFLAGSKWSHIGGLFILALIAFIGMIMFSPYRSERLTTFLHPELDPKGSGYQVNQAFLAIGSGGILGRGIGSSRQKFQYLPEVQSDSIFAVIGEETGFLISSLLVIAFLGLFLRGFKIAKKAPDKFSQLVVAGIIIWIAAQTIVNIGGMIGLLPLTGVPLPLVSNGAAALIMILSALGVVLNISKYQRSV